MPASSLTHVDQMANANTLDIPFASPVEMSSVLAPPVPTTNLHNWVVFALADPLTHAPKKYPLRQVAIATGSLRHNVTELAQQKGYPESWIKQYCCGHDDFGGSASTMARLRYVALPRLNSNGDWEIGHVAPVLPRNDTRTDWLQLDGWLSFVDGFVDTEYRNSQTQFLEYTGSHKTWVTITPVLLPVSVYETNFALPEARQLLFCDALGMDTKVKILTRSMPFFSSTTQTMFGLPAHQYWYPKHISNHRFSIGHMRLDFEEAVQGPILAGLGQFRGFGLFRAIG
jgi:CRISPR-associated protein Csb2